jgi:RimJ/RimL family protein N-acetyltransferase
VQDAEFLFRLLNSPGWLQFIGDRKVYTMEAAKQYIQRIQSTTDFYYWVIKESNTNLSLGIISFLKRDYLPHFDIGFALLPEYCKMGVAFEAASVVCEYYKSAGHNPILATVLRENGTSIRLLEKMGFTFERDIDYNGQVLQVFTSAT